MQKYKELFICKRKNWKYIQKSKYIFIFSSQKAQRYDGSDSEVRPTPFKKEISDRFFEKAAWYFFPERQVKTGPAIKREKARTRR